MSTHTESVQNHTGHETAHEHDHTGVFVATLIALLILTGITVGASYIDFGSGNVVIALFIASIKAILVALFFMHLRYEKPVNGIVAAAGFLFLGIFLMFCFIDVGAREPLQPVNLHPALPPPTAGPNAPAPGAAPAPGTPAPPPAAAPK
ncbi:MAG: cytochrome C oxidase subunit IV family protein [Bryobacteraceae bacterium]|jgi:cytochrome c oxidase subunit 4